MNIYQVVDTKTRKVVAKGFQTKQEAKVLRNAKNEETNGDAEGDGKPRFVISRGTDHPLGPTDGVTIHNTPKQGSGRRRRR